jgi:hypothetical protein
LAVSDVAELVTALLEFVDESPSLLPHPAAIAAVAPSASSSAAPRRTDFRVEPSILHSSWL